MRGILKCEFIENILQLGRFFETLTGKTLFCKFSTWMAARYSWYMAKTL